MRQFKRESTWSRLLLGLEVAQEIHHVKPETLVRFAPLLSALLCMGFSNGILPLAKIEEAFQMTMKDDEEIPGGQSQSVWVSRLPGHVKNQMNMLRALKSEDEQHARTPLSKRRYHKSGGFRNRL